MEERERHQARTRTFTEVYGTLGREGAPLMLVDGYNVVMNDKFLAEIVEEVRRDVNIQDGSLACDGRGGHAIVMRLPTRWGQQ